MPFPTWPTLFGAFLAPPVLRLPLRWPLTTLLSPPATVTRHHSLPRFPSICPASGGRSCADLPPWRLPATDHLIDKERTGPDLGKRRVYIQYVTEPGIF